MVPYVSAPVASLVMPPVVLVLIRTFIVSLVLRSGEIGYISSPCLADFMTRFDPV